MSWVSWGLLGATMLPIGGWVIGTVISTPWWHRIALGHIQRAGVPFPHCIEIRCECGDRWEDWS